MIYIDVSHYDWDRHADDLDWETIYDAGVQAVCVRLTYGDPDVYAPETRFAQAMCIGARNAGLYVGGYHNLVRGDFASMKRQVDWFREELSGGLCEWAMVDVEPYPALINKSLNPLLEDALRFAARFRADDDERRLVTYLARWVWSGHLGVPSPSLLPLTTLTGGVLVNANYAVKTGGDFRDIYASSQATLGVGWSPYGNVVPYVWQYASNAVVPGASPLTDVDATPGSLREFKERTRWL